MKINGHNKKHAQVVVEHILLLIAVIVVVIAVTSNRNGPFANAIKNTFQLPKDFLNSHKIIINP